MKAKSTTLFLILTGLLIAACVIGLFIPGYGMAPSGWVEQLGAGNVFDLVLLITPVMLTVFLICLIRTVQRKDRPAFVHFGYALIGVSAGMRICQLLAEWWQMGHVFQSDFAQIKSKMFHESVGAYAVFPFFAVYAMILAAIHELSKDSS